MAITPEGIIKRRKTMRKKYGKEYYKIIGAKGGSKEAHGDKPRGFQLNTDLARKNGLKRRKS